MGIDIGSVREIIQWAECTPVPEMPEHVLGVINLRGKVLPVIDLRKRLGATMTDRTRDSCIIILDGARGSVGALVDSVREVLDFTPEQLEPATAIGLAAPPRMVEGVGKIENQVVLILKVTEILGDVRAEEGAVAA